MQAVHWEAKLAEVQQLLAEEREQVVQICSEAEGETALQLFEDRVRADGITDEDELAEQLSIKVVYPATQCLR